MRRISSFGPKHVVKYRFIVAVMLLLYFKQNISAKLWSERENQQDATVRCLLSTLSQHVSGIIIPIFRRARRVRFRVRAPYNAAPHNRYQPHPAEPTQHTTCSSIRLVLLEMGIMMPETCWESVDNKHITVASCWFSLSLHNLPMMHGHRNLKFPQRFLHILRMFISLENVPFILL